MTKSVSWLTISDVHLGKRGRTIEILKNLKWYLGPENPWYPQIRDVDILFIAGDLFDDSLDFKSDEVHEIILWLSQLFHFCNVHDIRLRILEGTPSHDHRQSRIADTALRILKDPLDFRYISKIEVEIFEDLGVSCLYIPDEYGTGPDANYQECFDALRQAGLSQADIGIYHGFFKFQLPAAIKDHPAHDENSHLSLIKGFINIGHDHSFKTYKRLIVQGSFDRLSHGEEEPKGGVLCVHNPDSENRFHFVENKHAKVFKTVDLKSPDLEKSLTQLRKALAKIPELSYVRIRARKTHPLYLAFEELKIKFPMYNFSKKSVEDEQEESDTLASTHQSTDDKFMPIHINKDNIVELLMREVSTKHSLTQRQLTLLSSSLEGMV